MPKVEANAAENSHFPKTMNLNILAKPIGNKHISQFLIFTSKDEKLKIQASYDFNFWKNDLRAFGNKLTSFEKLSFSISTAFANSFPQCYRRGSNPAQ